MGIKHNSKDNDPLTVEEVADLGIVSQPTKYAVQVKCANCGDERFYTLDKGVTKEEGLEQQLCKKCNCNIVVKFNKPISPYMYKKKQQDGENKLDKMEQAIDFTELDDDVE